jgi:hypothetical protein
MHELISYYYLVLYQHCTVRDTTLMSQTQVNHAGIVNVFNYRYTRYIYCCKISFILMLLELLKISFWRLQYTSDKCNV